MLNDVAGIRTGCYSPGVMFRLYERATEIKYLFNELLFRVCQFYLF
jgi:hypothetical protein